MPWYTTTLERGKTAQGSGIFIKRKVGVDVERENDGGKTKEWKEKREQVFHLVNCAQRETPTVVVDVFVVRLCV